MQSQLLSGGLPLQLFPYFFSAEQLANIEKDAAEGVYNADFLIDLRKAMQVRQEDLLTDKEKLLHSIIQNGLNEGIDLACETLQAGLKKKGGLVANYCKAGNNDGMILTRAAFAVLVKF
jgi:hypothetical protein